jgi:hypothetical protein
MSPKGFDRIIERLNQLKESEKGIEIIITSK